MAIQTMAYRAKVLKKFGNHKKGSLIRVTRGLGNGKLGKWIIEATGQVIPNKSYIDLLKQWYDPNCIYSPEEAQAFVRNHPSDTNYLIWCNKWGQRVYVFQGHQGAWKQVKRFRCGTGNIKYGDGSDQGIGFGWKIWDKKKVFQGPQGKQYWNMHYTSAHGNSIHKGPAGKPVTHGCISLNESCVKWIFNNVPINTRVIVY